MSKFTFICEDEPMPFGEGVTTRRIFNFDAVQLDDIVEEFERFLLGAGFNLNGRLEIVPPETVDGHSSHYYDTERNKPINSLEKMSTWLAEYDRMGNCSK